MVGDVFKGLICPECYCITSENRLRLLFFPMLYRACRSYVDDTSVSDSRAHEWV